LEKQPSASSLLCWCYGGNQHVKHGKEHVMTKLVQFSLWYFCKQSRVISLVGLHYFFSKSERKSTAEGIKCLKAFINNRVIAASSYVYIVCLLNTDNAKF